MLFHSTLLTLGIVWRKHFLNIITGREFTIQMGKISGENVNAWWYDTRTGEAYKIGEYENKGSIRFDPPGVKYNGNDWVLVLDNAAKMFGKPGVVKQ